MLFLELCNLHFEFHVELRTLAKPKYTKPHRYLSKAVGTRMLQLR